MSNHVWLLTGPLKPCLEEHKPSLRQWLARGKITRVDNRQSPAARLMNALGHSQVNPDVAAFRYYSHARPPEIGFITAADPVYLEPRLDHLCLFASAATAAELERLSEHVNRLLADDGRWSLEVHGSDMYLVSVEPWPSSASPTAAITGLLPNEFMPDGEGAAEYRRRLSEFEMALHEHPVNLTRVAEGQQPINSLWLWGGGELPVLPELSLPTLLSDDSHLRGVWRAAGREPQPLPEQIGYDDLMEDLVVGPLDGATSVAAIEAMRRALRSGDLAELTILSLDGFVIRQRKRDWLRMFRRPHEELA